MQDSGKRRARLLVVAVIVAAAFGGLGLAGLAAHAATRATRVTATEREYRITLSRRSFKPGMVTFVAQNLGKLSHEFKIRGPGIAGKRIAGTIAPGAKRSLTVRLRRGSYTIWCPLHVAMGMKTTITVGGASSAGTTTSSGGGGWG